MSGAPRITGKAIGASRRNGLPEVKPYVWCGQEPQEQPAKAAPVRQPPGTEILHGVPSGFGKHKRLGIPIDENDTCGCRAARNAAKRGYAARAKKARKK